MSVTTDIFDQLKEIILEENPRLSGRFELRQNPPDLNKPGEEFMRISFNGGRTDKVSVKTSDKITSVQINYYKVAGSKQKLDYSSRIKESIIQNIPMHNRPYWWKVEQINELDVTDLESNQYEGFQLEFDFHTAISITCGT